MANIMTAGFLRDADTQALVVSGGVGGGADAKGVIVWDGTGTQPDRPDFTSVEWICPVDPAANAEDGDTWVPTA